MRDSSDVDEEHGDDAGGDLALVLVAAVASNGVIGRDGDLPWHYPEDLRRFKETTMGHPVVMGRRTFEGIVDGLGEPLPGRTSVVLTRSGLEGSWDGDAVVEVSSVEAALDAAAATGASVVYVVGGATVYEQFLPLADRLVLTEIHASHEGDVRFPEVDWAQWREAGRESREAFDFVEYVRRE